MYTGFFRLQKKPFQITCDPDFLWMGRKYQEALSALTSGVMQKKGLVVLTGDVGTGKTTLLNRLVEDIKDIAWTARISDPGVGKYDFYRMVAQDLGLPLQIRKRNDFFDLLACFLHDAHANEKSVVLFIDEAQRLRHDLLEEIREISNLEPPGRKCLTLFLVGQSEFNVALIRPENLAITRQIAISYTLGPLDATETAGYIQHRLKVAGAVSEIFSKTAVDEVFRFSGGFPRQINIICDLSLFFAFKRKSRIITPNIVAQCQDRLSFKVAPAPFPEKTPSRSQRPLKKKTLPPAAPPSVPTLEPESTRLPSKPPKKWFPEWLAPLLAGMAILGILTAGGYFLFSDSTPMPPPARMSVPPPGP